MNIEQRQKKIIDLFKDAKEWEERYRRMINLGRELPAMPSELKTEENKVKGCQSQVWLHGELQGEKIVFTADSDAAIVKGIVAILLHVYSGSTPEEILKTRPDFLEEMGLRQHLSMNRGNGLTAMVKQIQIYALAFQTKLNLSKGNAP